MMSLLLVLALVPDIGLRFMNTSHSGPSRQRLTYAADEAVVEGEDAEELSDEDPPSHAEVEAGH
jgi:hypothetical protein